MQTNKPFAHFKPFILILLCLKSATAEPKPADPTTLKGKVICGYQGWFFVPGDGNDPAVAWRHWARAGEHIGPDLYCVEIWPDVSEYTELFPVPNTQLTSGQPPRVFSSASPTTVDKHFEWMKQYGIDGAFLQRFVVELNDPPLRQARNKVLSNVRAAAKTQGRVYAVEYDLSGCRPDSVYQQLTEDWKYLVDDLKVRNDPQYLHDQGKPVIIIWGLGFNDKRFTPEIARRIQDFFKNDPTYGGNRCIGGVPWGWRSLSNDSKRDQEWAEVYRRWDIIHPWTVGAYHNAEHIQNFKKDRLEGDIEECKKLGIGYLPVVWPGFSWDNLKRYEHGKSNIPRRSGQHLWDQVHACKSLGAESLFIAMFDELDEATAIMKISDDHPTTGHWITTEGMPDDWYLQLANVAGKVIREEIPLTQKVPIIPQKSSGAASQNGATQPGN